MSIDYKRAAKLGANAAQLSLIRSMDKKSELTSLVKKRRGIYFLAITPVDRQFHARLRKAGFNVGESRGQQWAVLPLRTPLGTREGKTSMPSRTIGKIIYEKIQPVANAYKTTPQKINTLVNRAVAHAAKTWRWKPSGLVVSFHNKRNKSGRRSMGISWPNRHPAGRRDISLHVDNFATDNKTFEGVILHELAHHYTEETRPGKRPPNSHDLEFCVNYRKVHPLIKNQQLCQFYFRHEEQAHLRGKPGMYTRMGPSRRTNPTRTRSAPKLYLPPPKKGGIED